MAAIKAYMAFFIEAMEQRLIGQIGAIERCFLALEAQQAPSNAPNHLLKPLLIGDSR
jgi:hypothetical protein